MAKNIELEEMALQKIKESGNDFEMAIFEHLKRYGADNLYWMSNLYELCCNLTGRKFNNILSNRAYFSKKLRDMKKKGLIDIRRVGTGYGGKADIGTNSLNTYTLPGFWL